jgi:hypothetical protein
MTMDTTVALTLAGLLITCIVGFARLIRSVSRIELKLELLWDDYEERKGPMRIDGRRRTYPTTS